MYASRPNEYLYFKKIASQYAIWYGFNLFMCCICKALKFIKSNNKKILSTW